MCSLKKKERNGKRGKETREEEGMFTHNVLLCMCVTPLLVSIAKRT